MPDEVNVTLSLIEIEQLIDALQLQNAIETTILQAEGQNVEGEDPLVSKMATFLGWNKEQIDQKADSSFQKLNIYDDLQFEEEFIWRQATVEAEKEAKKKKLKLNAEEQFKLACKKYDQIMEKLLKQAKPNQPGGQAKRRPPKR